MQTVIDKVLDVDGREISPYPANWKECSIVSVTPWFTNEPGAEDELRFVLQVKSYG